MAHKTGFRSGFTVIELLIVVAVVAVVLTLAAPSFSSLILMQRLKGINAQVVTDLQYARSDAVGRGVPVYVKFSGVSPSAPTSCYILYTSTIQRAIPPDPNAPSCNCAAAEGSRCTNAATAELRTVQVPASLGVLIAIGPGDNFSFDPRTGGMLYGSYDYIGPPPEEYLIDVYADSARKLRDVLGISGRVKVCIPTGSTIAGDAC
jgi:type IV fimbrial biogenesis protein FimT